MKRRYPLPINILTYTAIVLLLVFILVISGLTGSLAVLNLMVRFDDLANAATVMRSSQLLAQPATSFTATPASRLAVAGPQEGLAAVQLQSVVRAPRPTFTPGALPPTSPTPTPTWFPWLTPTATEVPVPAATSLPLPVATPWPTATLVPAQPVATPAPTTAVAAPGTVVAAPTTVVAALSIAVAAPGTAVAAPRPVAAVPVPATPTPAPPLTPGYDYLVNEVYLDHTTVPFLTGYVAIVNYQEIPIGGIKAVGVFEPGGQRYESPLSKWFFDVATAPGAVAKTGSVKFEPGGIQLGTWFIHLENEQGTRLSEDVAINTDPDNLQWFYIKFKKPNPGQAIASAPVGGSGTGAFGVPTRTIPSSGPTPTLYPTPVPTATSVSQPTAPTDGWTFAGVRSVTDQGDLIVYGDVVNNTGSSQQISHVSGTFYDGQGQVIAGQDDTYDYWPVEVVPVGGRVPFELDVYGIQGVGDLDLQVISQPMGETPRQNFEFLGVTTSTASGSYCVTGKLRNPGDGLSHYLVISAALYNGEDQVINFDSLEVPTPGLVVGDKTQSFSLCIDTFGQQVADYAVQAWGK